MGHAYRAALWRVVDVTMDMAIFFMLESIAVNTSASSVRARCGRRRHCNLLHDTGLQLQQYRQFSYRHDVKDG